MKKIKLTIIVCELQSCMYNKERKCQCDTIGVNAHQHSDGSISAVCDTYYILPDLEDEIA